MIAFGKRLKELREESGMGQKELAHLLNTSKQNISRWENGYYEPDQETMIKLAKFFSVSLDYLMGIKDY